MISLKEDWYKYSKSYNLPNPVAITNEKPVNYQYVQFLWLDEQSCITTPSTCTPLIKTSCSWNRRFRRFLSSQRTELLSSSTRRRFNRVEKGGPLCADYTTLERDREFRRGELEFIIKYSIVISRQPGDAYPTTMILNRYSFPLPTTQALLYPHSVPSVCI